MPENRNGLFRTGARVFLPAALLLALGACQTGGKDMTASRAFQLCEEPRPEFCTYQYDPVCGSTQNPNDSEPDWKVYGNACTACANPEVVGYKTKAGECSSAGQDRAQQIQ